MITLDTSGLLAALDPGQLQHEAAKSVLLASRAPRLLSPFVLAEVDYLLTARVSHAAARLFLGEVAAGAYELVLFNAQDIAGCLEVLDQYSDQGLGLADASVWYIANRYPAPDILTLDHRHFRLLTQRGGRPFRLLPADSS